jgi:hypothetical protein
MRLFALIVQLNVSFLFETTITFITPIFFYHKLVNSSPALGFGGVVTPPALALYLLNNI